MSNGEGSILCMKGLMGESWDEVEKESGGVGYKVVKGENNSGGVDIEGGVYSGEEI